MRNMNIYRLYGITYSRHFTVPNYTKSREVYYGDICAEHNAQRIEHDCTRVGY